MAFRPYNDTNGANILSDYMARSGHNVGLCEFQLSINGWISQMLAVKGNVSALEATDIAPFAARRGYPKTSFAVQRITEVIRGASAPVFELASPDKWRMRFGPKNDVPTLAEMKQLYTEWCTKFICETDGVPGAGKDPSLVHFQSQVGSSIMWSGTCVPSWRVDSVDSHKRWIKSQRGAPRQWREPMAWFTEWCASRGLNLSQAIFQGVSENKARGSFGNRPGGAGFTIIMGPMDLFGYQPIWHMPLIDECLGLLDFGNQEIDQTAFVAATSTSFSTVAGSANVAIRALFAETESRVVRSQQGSRHPAADQANMWNQYATVRSSGYVVPVPAASVTALRDSLGILASDLIQSTANGTVPNYGTITRNYQFNFANWKVCVPYGLEHLKVGINAATSGGEFVPWIRFSMDRMYLATRFQVLREYAARCKADPATKPVDAANLQKFLDKSEDKADAVIYSSVLANSYESPSMGMVEAIELVVKGKDADVNVLDDEQGEEKIKLRTFANKLAKDRSKGRAHSFFSNVVDESLDLNEMFSPFVLAEAHQAHMWSLSVSDAVGADDTILGVKAGGQATAVDPEDAAFLVSQGATSTVPDRVWSAAAITPATIADMQSVSSGQLSGRDIRPNGSVKNNSVKWDNLSPSAFCDARGYPVLDYADQDSFVRAMLVLKGPDGDPSDLLASMFFANTLEM